MLLHFHKQYVSPKASVFAIQSNAHLSFETEKRYR